MNDKIKINLQIADSNYPLTINREEEQMVREAAKQVNIRLNKYREVYKNLEPEKIIAMVAYQFSLERLQLMQRNDTSPYVEKVKAQYPSKNNCFDIWRCVFIYILKLNVE
jgi:cell division protein ZapA